MLRIQIQPTDRVAVIGKTTSGKTFLVRHLLAGVPRLIVLDPKGTIDSKEWNVEPANGSLERQMRRGMPGRIRYRTPSDGNWEPILKLAMELGNVLVYIDELYGVAGINRKPSENLTAIYTRGRELGIGCWAAMQRPKWVPVFALSEAEWVFMFRLNMPQDRKYVSDQTHPDMAKPIRDVHGFWVYTPAWDKPRYERSYTPVKKEPSHVV